MNKKSAEWVKREQADERDRSADGAGDERVAPDPTFEGQPVTHEHERAGGDECCAVPQSLLAVRQLAECDRKLAPSPAADVDRQSNRREVDKPGSTDCNKRLRGTSSRVGVWRRPLQHTDRRQ